MRWSLVVIVTLLCSHPEDAECATATKTLSLSLPTRTQTVSRSISSSLSLTSRTLTVTKSLTNTYSGTPTMSITPPITGTVTHTTSMSLPTSTMSLSLPTASKSESLPTATVSWSFPTATVSMSLPTATATITFSLPTQTVSFSLPTRTETSTGTTVTNSRTLSVTLSLPTISVSLSLPTSTRTISLTFSDSLTLPTGSNTFSKTYSSTVSLSLPTASRTVTDSLTKTQTVSLSLPTPSYSMTFTRTFSLPTRTRTTSLTMSVTKSLSESLSHSYSETGTQSATVSLSLPTATRSKSDTFSLTETYSLSKTASLSVTFTGSITKSKSVSDSFTITLSNTLSESASESLSLSKSGTLTLTMSESLTVIQFDNYTTSMFPNSRTGVIEGQEVRLSLSATVDGVHKKLFNNTNNILGELIIKVFRYQSNIGYRCKEYVSGATAIRTISRYGIATEELGMGDVFSMTAFVSFTAPHHDSSWLICFKHRPHYVQFIHNNEWLLFTEDSGYALPETMTGSAPPINQAVWTSVASGVWFEVKEPTVNQYAVIKIQNRELDWNFTMGGSNCSMLPRDNINCAKVDSVKVIPSDEECSKETYESGKPYLGSAFVSATGEWLPTGYPAMSDHATSGGVAIIGTELLHPQVESFSELSQQGFVIAFVKLPPSVGSYSVCFSSSIQRSLWKLNDNIGYGNESLPSRPMWRKIWNCNSGCASGAPTSGRRDAALLFSTRPVFEVFDEQIKWSIMDLTERTWGTVRIKSNYPDLSRLPTNITTTLFSELTYWSPDGGDQLRLVNSGYHISDQIESTPLIGCWDTRDVIFSETVGKYPSSSRDLIAMTNEAPSLSNVINDLSSVTTSYSIIFTGRRYQSRQVCYRKGSIGQGWRVLPWDDSGEWSSLHPPSDSISVKPEPLIAGSFQNSPDIYNSELIWAMNDTRAATWGPIWIAELNRSVSSNPPLRKVRIVHHSRPCDYPQFYDWSLDTESELLPMGTTAPVLDPPAESIIFDEEPLWIQAPNIPGEYVVCCKTLYWNWRSIGNIMRIQNKPAITLDITDNRSNVDVVVEVTDSDSLLSGNDIFKFVRPTETCIANSQLSSFVIVGWCDRCRPSAGVPVLSNISPTIAESNSNHTFLYFTIPKGDTKYNLCYRQQWSTNWIVLHRYWSVRQYALPSLWPQPGSLRSSVIRQFTIQQINGYSSLFNSSSEMLSEDVRGFTDYFEAKFISCDDSTMCVSTAAGTEAAPTGCFTTSKRIITDSRLAFTITTPDRFGCYKICYRIDDLTWHKSKGEYNIFSDGSSWEPGGVGWGTLGHYNAMETIKINLKLQDYAANTLPHPAGDVLMLVGGGDRCGDNSLSNRSASVIDLGPGDELTSSPSAVIILPKVSGLFRVCLFVKLPDISSDEDYLFRSWIELPSAKGDLLMTVPSLIISWEYFTSGIQTTTTTTSQATDYYDGGVLKPGFLLQVDSSISGAVLFYNYKLVLQSHAIDVGCLAHSYVETSFYPELVSNGIVSLSFITPSEIGVYILCFKDNVGGGWTAVPGLLVVEQSEYHYQRLNSSVMSVALSSQRVLYGGVSKTDWCYPNDVVLWDSVVNTEYWKLLYLPLPPTLSINTFGRYAVCFQTADGSVFQATNAGPVVSGGGSLYFQQGRIADAISTSIDNSTFETLFVGTRISIWNPLKLTQRSVRVLQTPTTFAVGPSGQPSYSHIATNGKVDINLKLLRLNEKVPYGTGVVVVIQCPEAKSIADLSCPVQSAGLKTSFLWKTPTGFANSSTGCFNLRQGASYVTMRLLSKCPNEYGCGFRLRVILQQNVEILSPPIWINILKRRPDSYILLTNTSGNIINCFSGRECLIKIQAVWKHSPEVAPSEPCDVFANYSTAQFKVNPVQIIERGLNWKLGGVLEKIFIPTLSEGVDSSQIEFRFVTKNSPKTLVVVHKHVVEKIDIIDILPFDSFTRIGKGISIPSSDKVTVPVDTWDPSLPESNHSFSYLQAMHPYVVLLKITDNVGELFNQGIDFSSFVFTSSDTNPIMSKYHRVLDDTKSNLLYYETVTEVLHTTLSSNPEFLLSEGDVRSPNHFTHFVKIRITNSDNCGRYNPCNLNIRLDESNKYVNNKIITSVPISVRIPATTIKVEAITPSKSGVGVGVTVKCTPGTPTFSGFVPDEYHSGVIFPWSLSSKSTEDVKIISSSNSTIDDKSTSQNIIIRTSKPCIDCIVTFHSTTGAGPDGSGNSEIKFSLMNDVDRLHCPTEILTEFYRGHSKPISVTVAAVSVFGKESEWPNWVITLTTTNIISNMNSTVFMNSGIATFNGIVLKQSDGFDLVDGKTVELHFTTRTQRYSNTATGTISTGVRVLSCSVTLLLKELQNPIEFPTRIFIPNTKLINRNPLTGDIDITSHAVSGTISVPVRPQRLFQGSWIPDLTPRNYSVNNKFPWECSGSACRSPYLTIPSEIPDQTIISESGDTETVTYGTPTLQISSKIPMTSPTDGSGDIIIDLASWKGKLTPLYRGKIKICLLASTAVEQSNQQFAVEIACVMIYLSLLPVSPETFFSVEFVSGGTEAVGDSTAMVVPGIEDFCGVSATKITLLIRTLYYWNSDTSVLYQHWDQSINENIVNISSVLNQIFVSSDNLSSHGTTIQFNYSDKGNISFYGITELSTNIIVSAKGMIPYSLKTIHQWKIPTSERSQKVVISSPVSDDNCYEKLRYRKKLGRYLYSKSVAGFGFDITQSGAVAVGVPFPIQIRVLTSSGHRSYSHPKSKILVTLKASSTCSNSNSFAIGLVNYTISVLSKNGFVPESNFFTTQGQLTLWITLHSPCVDCYVESRLCYSLALASECVERPTTELPSLSERLAFSSVFSSSTEIVSVLDVVSKQRLPSEYHLTGSLISITMERVIAISGDWVVPVDATTTTTIDLKPEMNIYIRSVWTGQPDRNRLHYGNGGFLRIGNGTCGVGTDTNHDGRWIALNQLTMSFKVSFIRPCSGCKLLIQTASGDNFYVRWDAYGEEAIFKVKTCAHSTLLVHPQGIITRKKPFSIAAVNVDSSNIPAGSEDGAIKREMMAFIGTKTGNGMGGEVQIDEYNATDLMILRSGTTFYRARFSRSCWECIITVGNRNGSFTVSGKPTRFVVTKIMKSIINSSHVEFDYFGYIGDDSGDLSLFAGGPSLLAWQQPQQYHRVKFSNITLIPSYVSREVVQLQASDGSHTADVYSSASVELSSKTPVVDGALYDNNKITLILNKGPVPQYDLQLQFDGNPISVVDSKGESISKVSWSQPAAFLYVKGSGNSQRTMVAGDKILIQIGMSSFDMQSYTYYTSLDPTVANITVDYNCVDCVGCTTASLPTVIPQGDDGIFLIVFSSLGEGRCVVTASHAVRDFYPQQIRVEILKPKVKSFYWTSGRQEDSLIIKDNATRPSTVSSHATGYLSHSMSLRGLSESGIVLSQHGLSDFAVSQLQVEMQPLNCFKLQSVTSSVGLIILSGRFYPPKPLQSPATNQVARRCVFTGVVNLPEGTILTQTLDVRVEYSNFIRIEEQLQGNRILPVSGDSVTIAARDDDISYWDSTLRKIHIYSGRVISITVLLFDVDNLQVTDSISVAVASLIPSGGNRSSSIHSFSSQFVEGRAVVSFTINKTTRIDGIHHPFDLVVGLQNDKVAKGDAYYPWITPITVAEVTVGTGFDFVELEIQSRESPFWKPSHEISIVSGYYFNMRITMKSRFGDTPSDIDDEFSSDVLLLEEIPPEQPHLCARNNHYSCVNRPIIESDKLDIYLHKNQECLYVQPTPCVESAWKLLHNNQRIVRLQNGRALIRNISLLASNRASFFLSSLSNNDRVIAFSFVEIISIKELRIEGSDCMRLQQNKYPCSLPKYDGEQVFLNATHLRSIRQDPNYEITKELMRLSLDSHFEIQLTIIGSNDEKLKSIANSAVTLLIVCEVGDESGNTTLYNITKPIDDAEVSFSSLFFSAYCARAVMTLQCYSDPEIDVRDLLNGKIVEFPAFEIGSLDVTMIEPDQAPQLQTEAPPLWIAEPTVQMSLEDLAVNVDHLVSVLLTDIRFRLGIPTINIFINWICAIPMKSLPVSNQTEVSTSIITHSMKVNTALCTLYADYILQQGEKYKRISTLEDDEDDSPCQVNCSTVIEFRVKGVEEHNVLFNMIINIVRNESSDFVQNFGLQPISVFTISPSASDTPLPSSDVEMTPSPNITDDMSPRDGLALSPFDYSSARCFQSQLVLTLIVVIVIVVVVT